MRVILGIWGVNGLEIKDVSGLGKPLSKLISVISRGAGAVTASYLVRKRTVAKIEEIEKVAAAIHKASGETGVAITYRDGALEIASSDASESLASDVPIEKAASSRASHQARIRQVNVEAITSIAAEQLVDTDEVSPDEVEQDWINRFFRYAEDVSSEEMRKVWARLLSGEVQRPGSFSLRTMEFVRELSVSEAKRISVLASLVLAQGPRRIIPSLDDEHYGEGFTSEIRFELSEMGLIFPTELSLNMFMSSEAPQPVVLFQGNLLLQVLPPEPVREIRFRIHKLTSLGVEVMRLLDSVANSDLLERTAKALVGHGCSVTLGEVESVENDNLVFRNMHRWTPKGETIFRDLA